MKKKCLLIYLIYINLSFVFSTHIQASDNTKYLPTQFIAHNRFMLELVYDQYNQISKLQSIEYKADSVRNITDVVYQFDKGLLQLEDVHTTTLVGDSIINSYKYSDSYEYLINDSTIHITINTITTDSEKYNFNPEITISLNKDNLSYKYIYSDLSKGDTTIYTFKYDDRKRIVKIDEYFKYSSPIEIEIKRTWEVLDFNSPSYKSIYSDLNIAYQQFILIMNPMFIITSFENPKRIRLTETIDQDETSTYYIDCSYIYNDKGYPIQVKSQEYYDTPLYEYKGKSLVVDISYTPIK